MHNTLSTKTQAENIYAARHHARYLTSINTVHTYARMSYITHSLPNDQEELMQLVIGVVISNPPIFIHVQAQ
jgi:hypothetical protein